MAETKKYKVICCNCNKEIYATKSIKERQSKMKN